MYLYLGAGCVVCDTVCGNVVRYQLRGAECGVGRHYVRQRATDEGHWLGNAGLTDFQPLGDTGTSTNATRCPCGLGLWQYHYGHLCQHGSHLVGSAGRGSVDSDGLFVRVYDQPVGGHPFGVLGMGFGGRGGRNDGCTFGDVVFGGQFGGHGSNLVFSGGGLGIGGVVVGGVVVVVVGGLGGLVGFGHCDLVGCIVCVTVVVWYTINICKNIYV